MTNGGPPTPDFSYLKGLAEEQKAATQGFVQTAPSAHVPQQEPQCSCPNCGYCPHCGRGGYRTRPYWDTYPWWHNQPYWYRQPYCGGIGGTGTFC